MTTTTSTPPGSDIDIASRGLVLIGASPISSFSGTTTESQVAQNLYEDIVRSALTQTRWRFASNITQLSRLEDAPIDDDRYDDDNFEINDEPEITNKNISRAMDN